MPPRLLLQLIIHRQPIPLGAWVVHPISPQWGCSGGCVYPRCCCGFPVRKVCCLQGILQAELAT